MAKARPTINARTNASTETRIVSPAPRSRSGRNAGISSRANIEILRRAGGKLGASAWDGQGAMTPRENAGALAYRVAAMLPAALFRDPPVQRGWDAVCTA